MRNKYLLKHLNFAYDLSLLIFRKTDSFPYVQRQILGDFLGQN